jgi:hypothetical protein
MIPTADATAASFCSIAYDDNAAISATLGIDCDTAVASGFCSADTVRLLCTSV